MSSLSRKWRRLKQAARKPILLRCAAILLFQALTLGLACSQVLTHGPVTGGVTSSTANVFVRTDQDASVTLRYGTDPNLATYQESAAFTTSSESDFTKTVPLSGLTAEMTYYLLPTVNGVAQLTAPPYPFFKTFPESGTSRDFKFVVLTDFKSTKSLGDPTTTFASASAENPDFVFLGGDFDHQNPKELIEKREMFKTLYNRNTPYMSGFVPLILERSAIAHQWDDHDTGVNNIDRTYPGWPLTQQVYEEYVPTYPLPTIKPAIWQKFSYAQAECFVLDCRSQRDPERDPDNASKSMLDGNNLGATGELTWLKDGLLASTARWKIIFTSVVTNPSTKVPDGWGGYLTEWNALKEFINLNHIEGVVFIAGDLHLGAIDDGTASGFPEMCVASPNSEKVGSRCSTAKEGTWSEGYFDDPCSGYGVVSVLQNPDRLILEAVDTSGNVRISYTVTGPDENIPPMITAQPSDATVVAGTPATFSVSATGTAPLSYQWQRSGVNIPGATGSTYTSPPTTKRYNGAIFGVIVSNVAGSVTSNNATLTVQRP